MALSRDFKHTEERTDIYLSILRSHIAAMGGELKIVAHFPEGSIGISNFSKEEAMKHDGVDTN